MQNIRLNTLLILLLMLLSVSGASAAVRKTKIEIVDKQDGGGIPFVAVYIVGTQGGTLTDDRGIATIVNPEKSDSTTLSLSAMGYEKLKYTYSSDAKAVKIPMDPIGVQISEVTVKQKRKKYSKKNNPAVAFAERIKKLGPETDPKRNEHYNYNRNERISLGFNNFRIDTASNGFIDRKFGFLREHIDTSDVSGNPILIFSVKEKASEYHYRKHPKSEKTYVTGYRSQGLDDIIDQESVQVALEDIFREVDLYNNDINLFHSRFVSPLSRIAPDFYKFFLTDTLDIEGERCVELSFTPHNTASYGFTGHVYVPLNDSTMFVKRVDMHLPPGININFIDRLALRQDYEKAPDGSRLKTRDDIMVELSIIPGTQGLYARRNTLYDSHNFEPSTRPELFTQLKEETVDENAMKQTDEFWAAAEFAPRTRNENRMDELIKGMRGVPVYYWTEKLVKLVAWGYLPMNEDTPAALGPIDTFYSSNELEGSRVRLGGMTTTALSRHWFFRGYGAYGFKDKIWKYDAEVEYSFREKKRNAREFPVHSITLSHLYDVNQLGQDYRFTDGSTIFTSFLSREKNRLISYHRQSQLKYTLELDNHFSVTATLGHERQEDSRFIPFVDGNGTHFDHYNESSLEVELRYAPGEKFYQTMNRRLSITHDGTIIELSHKIGPKGFLGNTFGINRTELSLRQRFWFSAFGHTDIILRGGHVWSKSPFPSLLIPTANISYLVRKEAFALMNPMEFINDTYMSWDVTYNMDGMLFNLIPGFKRLKWREVLNFKGISGNTSRRNDPAENPELYRFPTDAHTIDMNWKPYMEASVGIENILRFFRVDYVWRLNYRYVPGISKSGIRVGVHFGF